MTQPINRTGAGSPGPLVERAPRMLLKADSAKSGYVDGAWWPYSDDLVTELARVLTPLAARLGVIHRLTYHLDEWASAPEELVFAGQHVRLDGYRHGTAHTVEVSGRRNSRLVLLVIAPGTAADRALSVMTSASGKNDESTVDELLTIGSRERVGRAAALRKWRRQLDARRIGWLDGVRKARS
jgi:hypothetical protein